MNDQMSIPLVPELAIGPEPVVHATYPPQWVYPPNPWSPGGPVLPFPQEPSPQVFPPIVYIR